MGTRESDGLTTQLVCLQVLTRMLCAKLNPSLLHNYPLDQKGTQIPTKEAFWLVQNGNELC